MDDKKGNGQMMGPELTVFDNVTPDRRKSPSQAMFPPGYDLSMRPRTGSPRPRTASSRHSQSLQQAEAEFLELASSVPDDESFHDYDLWAHDIMKQADSNRNGELSINELQTMCAGTEHQGFVEWLLFNRSAFFKSLDVDHSGTLQLDELARALQYFHVHIKRGESKPIECELDQELVARKMLEVMYRTATRYNPPSFKRLFEDVDTNSSGVLCFSEIDHMIRIVLGIPRSRLDRASLLNFYRAIDRDGNGTISLAEFKRFMMKMTMQVSGAFASIPAPPDGTPPWLRPKTYEELVQECRERKIIGGYSSIGREGPALPPRSSTRDQSLSSPFHFSTHSSEILLGGQSKTALPFPSPSTVLKRDLKRNITMKELHENTNFDHTGPRYQSTNKAIEAYHFGRVANHGYSVNGRLWRFIQDEKKNTTWQCIQDSTDASDDFSLTGDNDGFYCPTRWGGKRVRHGKPLLLKDGQPMNADEALFIEQRGATKTALRQPLFLRTLAETKIGETVFDRLSEVSTASQIMSKQYFAEDCDALARARRPRRTMKKFAPL